MNRVESSQDIFSQDAACSQAILTVYARPKGLDPKQALKISAGFGGGMAIAGTCGAVTGAIMALGLHLCGDDCDTSEGRVAVYARIKEFTTRFVEKNGSLNCAVLLGCDISTDAGKECAAAQNLHDTKCAPLVRSAAEILEELLPG